MAIRINYRFICKCLFISLSKSKYLECFLLFDWYFISMEEIVYCVSELEEWSMVKNELIAIMNDTGLPE